jgi:hypothetical protein
MKDSTMQPPHNPPHQQSADATIHELATLFAVGVLRLRTRKRVPPAELSANLSESSAQGLEFAVESRLTVPSG